MNHDFHIDIEFGKGLMNTAGVQAEWEFRE